MRHTNLPNHFYVQVDNQFLGSNMPAGTTPGMWHAIYARPGQYLSCHVILASGAHWSDLPLHALSTTESFDPDFDDSSQPWGAMGNDIEAVQFKALEGLTVNAFRAETSGIHTGIVIDWADGYSRYPAEHKPLSLIIADEGWFLLLPNNYFTVKDKHFVDTKKYVDQIKFYKRGDLVYWEID